MKLEVLEYLPEINSKAPPLLFIHGAYHGAWCWKENFLPYFSDQGFSSYALSLRGHGESEGHAKLHSFSLRDYVDDILKVMLTLKDKPVLIGHSMGGAIVQKLLHLHPDKIRSVVLMASVPPNGMLKDMIRLSFTNFIKAIKLTLFFNGKNVKIPTNIFFSKDLSVKKRDTYTRLLQPESTKARNDSIKKIVSMPICSKVPMLILGSNRDWFFSKRTTIGIGKAYKTSVIFTDASHDMMLDPNWRTVADQIITFVNESNSEER